MGRLFVLTVFAVASCFVSAHYFPGLGHHAFHIGQISITYLMLCGCVFFYLGKRLTGK